MLAGQVFLALWNDIAPHREREYDRWHTTEHVPERVAVTGFHGARRYVNRNRAKHRYFTLYEVASLETFQHSEYLDVVQQPTPWSASMRPDFRNLVRATCRVNASRGDGIGAAIAVLCHENAAIPGAVDAIAALLDGPGVVAAHLGEGSAGSSARWSQASADTTPQREWDRVLLIEALDRACASTALADAQRVLGLESLPPDFGCDVYDLAFVFPGHDSTARGAHRRATWPAS